MARSTSGLICVLTEEVLLVSVVSGSFPAITAVLVIVPRCARADRGEDRGRGRRAVGQRAEVDVDGAVGLADRPLAAAGRHIRHAGGKRIRDRHARGIRRPIVVGRQGIGELVPGGHRVGRCRLHDGQVNQRVDLRARPRRCCWSAWFPAQLPAITAVLVIVPRGSD